MSSSAISAFDKEPSGTDYSRLRESSKDLPEWETVERISVTRSARPDWKFGDGASELSQAKHIEIDPHEPGRPMFYNYGLLVSGIVPRPIGFVSTLSKDGTPNLAPFSYFQVVDHDPPVFVVGFSGRASRPKDTLTNLEMTGECTINVVSEHMVDAVNACSLDAPAEVSEWDVSGLGQAPSSTVRPARVHESIFSIEGRLCEVVEYKTSRRPVGPHGRLAIIEGTRFWVREDAIDEAGKDIDLDVLRPIGQLGGISYARMTSTYELARSSWITATKTAGDDLDKLISKRTLAAELDVAQSGHSSAYDNVACEHLCCPDVVETEGSEGTGKR